MVAPDLGGRPDSDAGVVRFSDSLALGRASGLGNLTSKHPVFIGTGQRHLFVFGNWQKEFEETSMLMKLSKSRLSH